MGRAGRLSAAKIFEDGGGKMTAYWIAHVTVLDPVKYKDYTDIAPLAFKKFGAVFLARGGVSKVLEGEPFERHVVIEFSDMQTALDCYNSPEYQAAKQKREGHCIAQVSIVEGLER
jgi:uncharacterized protein (DUF1330 family)